MERQIDAVSVVVIADTDVLALELLRILMRLL